MFCLCTAHHFVDWNPAVDKQAAARCWRDGQKKRCFTYRFLATGTVEEKIFQRQLSKEGLQSVVDDKEQVNALSTKDLRNLFKLRQGTPSDTHDKLRCERCKIIQDDAEMEALKVLPQKLAACKDLVDQMFQHEDSVHFHKPLVPTDHSVGKDEYEKLVKQPMDLGTIRSRLEMAQDQPSSYKSVSGVSKDVNRIFSNVLKVWSPGDEIADAARRLQSWWIEQWTELVPRLMTMKAHDDQPAKSEDPEDEILEGCATLNNERGDDYQEQIGMPDEENMRSWSHHPSTDTVDDPVFRAAMRGYDAVSFVFGLEVTWSLIQQRQQEEEERQAMKELENIEELQEAGEEEETAQEEAPTEEASPEVKTEDQAPVDESGRASDDESSHDESVQVLEDEDGESGSPSSDESDGAGSPQLDDDQSDSEESASAAIVDSPSSVVGKTTMVEAVESPASSDDEVPLIELAEPITSTPPDQEKENALPAPTPTEWECATCTLFNKKSLRKCSACGTRKQQPGKKRSLDEASL
jgi:hypothetical protein